MMQKILEEIETKDLSLEDVIDKYKQGIELSKNGNSRFLLTKL